MMAALRNRDDGFTLTELLIAMAIGIVVFGTACTTLVAYQNDAARSTRAIDSQEGARVAVDRIVHELRNVASSRTNPTLVEVAGPYNLVFQTIAPPPGGSANPVGVSRVRYCIPPIRPRERRPRPPCSLSARPGHEHGPAEPMAASSHARPSPDRSRRARRSRRRS